LPELSRLRQTVRRGPGLAATLDHGPTNNERPARLSGAGRLFVSMLLLGLVLVGWLLAVLPFAEHVRGDRPGPLYFLRLPSAYPKLRRSRTVYVST
jgi:hypothetical protein